MPTETGIWNQEEADKNHIFSYRTARWIAGFLDKNQHLYDVGCGKGTYSGYFESVGFKSVIGIDGIVYEGKECSQLFACDLTDKLEFNQKGNILCLEVGEHIPEQFLPVFIDNLTNNCNGWVVLSWAVPWQDGIGHVSCQTNDWVKDEFWRRGFCFMPEETRIIREMPEGYVNYFKETLMIFKKI